MTIVRLTTSLRLRRCFSDNSLILSFEDESFEVRSLPSIEAAEDDFLLVLAPDLTTMGVVESLLESMMLDRS